jgi:regulator of protease activity HflC (stomatin/prohibitin superfamily)
VFWIFLLILMLVICIPAIGYAMYQNRIYPVRREEYQASGGRGDEPVNYSLAGWAVAGLTFGLFILISGLMMFKTVGEREVAVVYNFSNTITGKRDKGLTVIAPWEHIDKENIGIQHEEWNFGQENSAVSLDQQKVFANLAVNFQIDPEKVVDLYSRVGAAWKSIIIDARVPQVFKEVTATFATQDITAKREQLRLDTREKLATELSPYDIKVVDVFVTNLGFSQVYTDSIEAKQKQVQDAQRAQARVAQVEAEARQKIAEAEGEAKSNVARAKGEAQANRLRRQSLTPALIQWEAIQKLNPNVSIIVCPPQSICVPNSGITPVPNNQP